jgi:hypothetical protein
MSLASQEARKRLDSWKEISAYLKHDLRTVQRWEHERNLPVRRPPGQKRGAVYAYRDELDAWLAGEDGSALDGRPSPAPDAPRYRTFMLLAVVALLLAGVAAMSVKTLRKDPGKPQSVAGLRVEVSDNRLMVFDREGLLRWDHAFPDAIFPAWGGHFREDETDQFWKFVDLNNDGQPELLTWLTFGKGRDSSRVASSALLAFSLDGRLLWRYEPEVSVTYGPMRFAGPWHIVHVLVAPERESSDVWLLLTDQTMGISPVVRLNGRTGSGALHFVNPGALFTARVLRTAKDRLLLIGGYNNEYRAGALAVLDADGPFAQSPQTAGTRYVCSDCPLGLPAAYYVFPRSDVSRHGSPDIHGAGLFVVTAETLEVSTFELTMAERLIYEFSPASDWQLLRRFPSSTYRRIHDELAASGALSHMLKDCPFFHASPPVRRWTPAQGWVELAVPNL